MAFSTKMSNATETIDQQKLQDQYHISQTQQLNDSLTLVDFDDNVVGSISKLNAHLKQNLSIE